MYRRQIHRCHHDQRWYFLGLLCSVLLLVALLSLPLLMLLLLSLAAELLLLLRLLCCVIFLFVVFHFSVRPFFALFFTTASLVAYRTRGHQHRGCQPSAPRRFVEQVGGRGMGMGREEAAPVTGSALVHTRRSRATPAPALSPPSLERGREAEKAAFQSCSARPYEYTWACMFVFGLGFCPGLE